MGSLASRHAKFVALEIICIRYYRESVLNILPKDVVKIIARFILESKNDPEWTRVDRFEHLKNDYRCIDFKTNKS